MLHGFYSWMSLTPAILCRCFHGINTCEVAMELISPKGLIGEL